VSRFNVAWSGLNAQPDMAAVAGIRKCRSGPGQHLSQPVPDRDLRGQQSQSLRRRNAVTVVDNVRSYDDGFAQRERIGRGGGRVLRCYMELRSILKDRGL